MGNDTVEAARAGGPIATSSFRGLAQGREGGCTAGAVKKEIRQREAGGEVPGRDQDAWGTRWGKGFFGLSQLKKKKKSPVGTDLSNEASVEAIFLGWPKKGKRGRGSGPGSLRAKTPGTTTTGGGKGRCHSRTNIRRQNSSSGWERNNADKRQGGGGEIKKKGNILTLKKDFF